MTVQPTKNEMKRYHILLFIITLCAALASSGCYKGVTTPINPEQRKADVEKIKAESYFQQIVVGRTTEQEIPSIIGGMPFRGEIEKDALFMYTGGNYVIKFRIDSAGLVIGKDIETPDGEVLYREP